MCFFDASSQNQTIPAGLHAMNGHSPVNAYRYHFSSSRAHDHEDHRTVVGVLYLEEELGKSSEPKSRTINHVS